MADDRLAVPGGLGGGGLSSVSSRLVLPIPGPVVAPDLTVHHPSVLGTYTVPRSERSGLEFDNVIPGGDHSLKWSMPCDVVGSRGFPPLAGDVVLSWGGQHVWEGLLVSRKIRTKKGKMTGLIDFEAIGYYQCLDFKRYLTSVTYGPPETGGSPIEAKVPVADIPAILTHVITQNSQFLFNYDGDPTIVGGVGIGLAQDSQSWAGSNGLDVLNFVATLVSYLNPTYVWQVKPRLIGGSWSPYFYFQPMETGASYYDDGVGEGEYGYDIRRHPNRVTVEWGNQQRTTEPQSPAVPSYATYGGRALLLDKYVRMANEYQGLADIEALAQGYLALFRDMKSSGTVTVAEPIRYGIPGGYGRIDPILLRSGKVIRVTNDVLGDDVEKYITGMAWREDSCAATLTIGELGGIYGELRRLVTVPNKAINWAIAFGGLSVGMGSGEGSGSPIIGQTYTPDPVSSGDPRVSTVLPTAAMTDGTHDFGPGGGKILPENVPTRFMGPMQQFRTTDGSPIAVADNVARAPTLDWKNLNAYQVLSKESATLTIRIKKNGSTVVTATLAGGTNTGIVPYAPFSTVQGDVLTYDIVANTASSDATIFVYGEADHPGYPSNLYPVP